MLRGLVRLLVRLFVFGLIAAAVGFVVTRLMGGEDEDFRDPGHRDSLLPAKTERLAHRFRELFPGAELEVERAWAGTFGETRDGLPYIGAHDDWPSCQFAIGYGGNGIVFSVLAAQIVRDAIDGRANPLANLFRFGR